MACADGGRQHLLVAQCLLLAEHQQHRNAVDTVVEVLENRGAVAGRNRNPAVDALGQAAAAAEVYRGCQAIHRRAELHNPKVSIPVALVAEE